MTIEEMNARKRELGYTDIHISRLSGIPLSTVRKVLGGKTKAPRYDTVRALTEVLAKEPVINNSRQTEQMPVIHGQLNKSPDAMNRNPGIQEKTESGTTCHYSDVTDSPLPDYVREASPAYSVKKQGDFTLKDYLALPDEHRAELIDGVIYDMSSPLSCHQLIAGHLYTELLTYIRKKGGPCIPFIAPLDVQLDCDSKTVVLPDVMVLCDRSKLTAQRIVGAPDFIIEVLSRSTKKKDMFIKLTKYKYAGVREYWLVDPDRKTVAAYHFEDDDAIHLYTFRDNVPVGIFGGDCMIDFAPIDDFISQLPII